MRDQELEELMEQIDSNRINAYILAETHDTVKRLDGPYFQVKEVAEEMEYSSMLLGRYVGKLAEAGLVEKWGGTSTPTWRKTEI
jgi:hypothetical protein